MAEYELNPFTRQMERVDAKVPVGASVTTNATLGFQVERVPVDTTAGNVTLTLPKSNQMSKGKQYHIAKMTSDSNTVIVDGNGSETINGSATYTIYFQYSSMHIVSNGDGTWSII